MSGKILGRLLVGMMLMVLCASMSHGQIVASVTDATCTTVGTSCSGPANDGCNTTTYVVRTQSVYTLTASMLACTGMSQCNNCYAAAYVWDPTGLPGPVCVTTSCNDPNCSPNSTQVTLTPGTYTVYACLLSCDPHSCTNCNAAGCTARATLANFP